VNGEPTDRRERARHLMMAALDGELSSEERAELDGSLDSDGALRKEWNQMCRVKELTDGMGYRELPEEIWDDYWEPTYNRLERGFGWILIFLGVVTITGYGAWHMLGALLGETSIPPFLKIAIFAALLGGLTLAFSVMREKWFVRRTDPYREVKR
jgi:ferric-dicitrate binding protein FerR (iron transport regulator)